MLLEQRKCVGDKERDSVWETKREIVCGRQPGHVVLGQVLIDREGDTDAQQNNKTKKGQYNLGDAIIGHVLIGL